MKILSENQIREAIELIEDLTALAKPSEFVKQEVEEVLASLRTSETITTEDYLTLNETLIKEEAQ